MKKPIRRIIVLLESPNGRYYGFRFIRCSDGKMVEGFANTSESNLKHALTYNHEKGEWHGDYFWTVKQTHERDIFRLPTFPSDSVALWNAVKKQLNKRVKDAR